MELKDDYSSLFEDTELLKHSMEIINDIIKDQGESLDLIEDEIRYSSQQIKSAKTDIDISERYNSPYSKYLYTTISLIGATFIYFLL